MEQGQLPQPRLIMPTRCCILQSQRNLAAAAALFLGALAVLCSPSPLLAADSKPATAPKLSAAQIVEKHVAARGGLQAWRGLQTLSLTGKMEAGSGDSIARSI